MLLETVIGLEIHAELKTNTKLQEEIKILKEKICE